MRTPSDIPCLTKVTARAYTIPTDRPEADGTFAWTSTTMVVVEVSAGDEIGIGYTYADGCIVRLIGEGLGECLVSANAMDIDAAWAAMQRRVRNLGRQGLAACAISAVDCALWDLKAKLLGVPVATLVGRCRDAVPIYGSGGFTSYTDRELKDQLSAWVERDGCAWVKMKIGTDPDRDWGRVAAARSAIGGKGLFVDANGAFDVKQACVFAERLAGEQDVIWFEEPVSSDDLRGLRYVREHAPASVEITAGEYGYDSDYFERMLASGAVDVQQADATRCGGFTGFRKVAALCDIHHTALSGHCAPALHLHAACTAPRLRHLEWFHDHVRIEYMLFDGAPVPKDGLIRPDLSRPGLGLALREQDAEAYRVA